MADIDTPETGAALRAFQAAGASAVADYAQRRINSEQCLQAVLYAALRRELSDDCRVFSEAAIRLSDAALGFSNKRKVVTDLVVCRRDKLVLGIELKYLPRSEPSGETLAKDVMSLSHLTNRHGIAQRARIEMPRYRHADGDALEFQVLTQRKLMSAIFCSEDARRFSEKTFCADNRPKAGYWADREKMPMNLGLPSPAPRSVGRPSRPTWAAPSSGSQKGSRPSRAPRPRRAVFVAQNSAAGLSQNFFPSSPQCPRRRTPAIADSTGGRRHAFIAINDASEIMSS